ncbi:MAG: hypothetical protein ACKVHE_35725 [Planctomycetales bacterium]
MKFALFQGDCFLPRTDIVWRYLNKPTYEQLLFFDFLWKCVSYVAQRNEGYDQCDHGQTSLS